jgi:holliday junction DNA helicase RuvA
MFLFRYDKTMFAKLTGIVDDIAEDQLVLDCKGVGYLVVTTARALDGVKIGDLLSLRIETLMGEDFIRLYGFKSADEQRWFRLLLSVQGVGARVALAILTVLSPEKLAMSIAAQDKIMLGQANGVGKKLAERIVIELKDKAAKEAIGGDFTPQATHDKSSATTKTGGLLSDVISALTNLGYRPVDALAAAQRAQGKLPADADLGTLIRVALKEAMSAQT